MSERKLQRQRKEMRVCVREREWLGEKNVKCLKNVTLKWKREVRQEKKQKRSGYKTSCKQANF